MKDYVSRLLDWDDYGNDWGFLKFRLISYLLKMNRWRGQIRLNSNEACTLLKRGVIVWWLNSNCDLWFIKSEILN